MRAATLLSKVFLHYLVMLGDMGGKELLDLWLKIVTIMDRLINSGQGDNLVSQCHEFNHWKQGKYQVADYAVRKKLCLRI